MLLNTVRHNPSFVAGPVTGCCNRVGRSKDSFAPRPVHGTRGLSLAACMTWEQDRSAPPRVTSSVAAELAGLVARCSPFSGDAGPGFCSDNDDSDFLLHC